MNNRGTFFVRNGASGGVVGPLVLGSVPIPDYYDMESVENTVAALADYPSTVITLYILNEVFDVAVVKQRKVNGCHRLFIKVLGGVGRSRLQMLNETVSQA